MKCFLLGATGFLGSRIADALLSRGDTVFGLTSQADHVDKLKNKGVIPVIGDIRKPEDWIDEIEGTDAVVQAAMLPLPNRPTTSYVESTIEVERHLLNRLLPALGDSTSFVYTSGTGIYGDSYSVNREEFPTHALQRSRKDVHAERLILEAVEQDQIKATIMRPAPIYGPGGIFHKFWGKRLAAGKRVIYPGSGDQLWSLISVWDCARAYLLAIDSPSDGEVFNVTDDEPVELKKFLLYLAEQMAAPSPMSLPKMAFKLLAGPVYAEAMFASFPATNDKIKKILGFKPEFPTYREGCAALSEAYQGQPPDGFEQ